MPQRWMGNARLFGMRACRVCMLNEPLPIIKYTHCDIAMDESKKPVEPEIKRQSSEFSLGYFVFLGIWIAWLAMFSGDDSSPSSSYSGSSSSSYTQSSRPRTPSAGSASSHSRLTSGSSPSITRPSSKPVTYRSKQSGAWPTEPSRRAKLAVKEPARKPCTVTDIIDGDTIVVRFPDGESVTIRLMGIDAPESDQAFGRESTNLLSSLISNRQVEVKGSKKDRHGRTLAHIHVDGIWVNRRMISRGLAWHYREYSSNADLSSAETASRARHAGLWAESDALAPWDYRSGMRRTEAGRKE